MSIMLAGRPVLSDAPAGRAAQRRQHILATSRRLFIKNGFHGTGVAQIAAASGIRVGQLYRDFSAKEDIIAAIALRDLSQFLDEASLDWAIMAGNREAIRRWILAFVTYDHDIDGYRLIPEIMAESSRNPRIAEFQEEITTRVRRALTAALTALAPGNGRKTARADLADLILTLSCGLCQVIVAEAQQGHDHQRLCARLQAIVIGELDLICHS
ncbi:TetR/AcrR family transcriptional regulator [Sphingomonas sp.]|uniref:TetR/AcrR family transcriptional regulator n=1 Tax=Sphingomonas sp. TaxID=28214 RepID=UPI003D6CE76E